MQPQLWNQLENLMAQNKAPRGNLGEWSELYTLGYLLVHGGAFAADENQEAMPDMFHKVLQVYLAGRAGEPETNYIINSRDIARIVTGKQIGRAHV